MNLVWSTEAARARDAKAPLVALETSVVAQGLPHPVNLEAARACEEAIRRAGAVPAAIAVVDGTVRVGLEPDELRALAEPREGIWKIGGRDLAIALAQRATGGTTVSATCEIAAAAGIRIFATGGIGGVHRGVTETLDVSQDLAALARFPVAVVCAGAKSVLDLPKTMEALETFAVPVIGIGTNELPAFYCRESGVALEHRAETVAECAQIVRARFEWLEQGGIVFALPPPEDAAMKRSEVELHVGAALAAAAERGVHGKAVTPFLLGELSQRSGGKSLRANVALLTHNARFAGELAVACARSPA